jgi:hypothetical protein
MSHSPRTRFRAALVLAVLVDAVQIGLFSLFVEGALSPLDDVLDSIAALGLISLLGWHWEFLPSFMAELVPGVDLVPFWTLAVANVYRKWKLTETVEEPERLHAELINVTPERQAADSERSTSGLSH